MVPKISGVNYERRELQRLYSNRKASEMQVKNQDFGENFKKEPEKVAGSYFL